MAHARSHGFPVPAARSLSDTDIEMDRLDGPTMLADMARRPWRIGRHAATLADLHRRLHAISAPAWLQAPVGEGDALLHLDLHPDNVILTSAGPVVIDWPNAARGPKAADVTHTWFVLACAAPPGGRYRRALTTAGRNAFVRLFLSRFDRRELRSHFEAVGAFRLANRALPALERAAVEQMVRSGGS
jgi:aminoglycoside phosphotransferase (APT) family kinase protein